MQETKERAKGPSPRRNLIGSSETTREALTLNLHIVRQAVSGPFRYLCLLRKGEDIVRPCTKVRG